MICDRATLTKDAKSLAMLQLHPVLQLAAQLPAAMAANDCCGSSTSWHSWSFRITCKAFGKHSWHWTNATVGSLVPLMLWHLGSCRNRARDARLGPVAGLVLGLLLVLWQLGPPQAA